MPMTTTRGETFAMLLDSSPKAWSSIEELHLQFSQALLACGFRVVLVFSEPLPEPLADRFQSIGARVETISYGEGILHYYRELRRIVREHSIGVVQITFFNYFELIPWLARLTGVGNVVYQDANSGILRAKGWKKLLIRLRGRAATMPETRVIAVSEFVRERLIDVGVPERKVYVVHYGIDTQRFSPDPEAGNEWRRHFAIEPDEVIVSSITNLRPFKHPEVILQAFASLRRRGVKARLFIAGGGEMRQEMEQLSHQLGISERAHWLGSIDNPESLLRASDIFVLASVGEAFGLVLPEAMACGVPVVGSRSGSIPEIVEDGKTGILATPLDPASFADAIERLARDETLRREMGKRAVERVQHYFTVETSINNLLHVYKLSRKSGKTA